MKTCWLNWQDNPDCILFMAGWGMGPEPFFELDFGLADVFMVYDYRQLDDFDFSALLPALETSRLHLLAWSLGIWVAARLFQEDAFFPALHFSSATAIGGTCQPIDNHHGIPGQRFEQMLADFSPAVVRAFYDSMFASQEEAERFWACRPQRPLAEMREELLVLRAVCAEHPEMPDIYSRRIVTNRDRIFSLRNQVRAWGRKKFD
ncbi:MAG: DUF452 family protein, partial [Candidatus Electrothrix sp. AR3]|nr:DUF452 family protein [Candidatus Electrothrix sp. AR3]